MAEAHQAFVAAVTGGTHASSKISATTALAVNRLSKPTHKPSIRCVPVADLRSVDNFIDGAEVALRLSRQLARQPG